LSTLASQPSPQPSWKQEINQRLAAHKTRKGLSVVESNTSETAQEVPATRAAQAAARVAARYAHAPSYSELQAAEARAALRAAEAATRAALEAQAAAQTALDNLAEEHRMLEEEQQRAQQYHQDCAPAPAPAAPPELKISNAGQNLRIRWEPDMPVFYDPAEAAAARDAQRTSQDPAFDLAGGSEAPFITIVEPAEPINANLIQFPREIVATRRVRPRIVENSSAPDPSPQLSIFEVDPSTISTAVTPPSAEFVSADEIYGPEWSGMKLDAPSETRRDPNPVAAPAHPRLELAPLNARLMAVAVDAALIVGLVCVAGALLAGWLSHFPAMRAAEIGAVAGLVLTTALYHLFFFMQIDGTPGMRYAHVALCTFEDENPTRDQLRRRIIAMLLSILPVGLGVAWALFDEDHLSWHDRISRTYLRAY